MEDTRTLTHINDQGRAKMVDVSQKADTQRIGVASGRIRMQPETFQMITEQRIKKGDVLAVAQVAGIMAAKKTWEIIPMCHPLLLTGVDIHFELYPEVSEIEAVATVKTTGKTGIEMEALHAVSAALLTIYDMCKAVDRGMEIREIYLVEKDGGKSGHFINKR
jgi:cyclic pyranopterin phosphate synthase